jgi:hypothetical protein
LPWSEEKLRAISDNWEFRFLLHNLELKEAFDSEFMAIVPNNDARLSKIIADVPAVASLIQNFTDQFGKQRYPCALLNRKDAPGSIKSLDAIVSFRNIFALSCLLYACPRTIKSRNVFFPLWLDFFDFYPISLTRDPNFLHILSPAINGTNQPQKFRAQVSPGLPDSAHLRFTPDDRILSPLLHVWTREFTKAKTSGRKTRVLFRSLEIAYQAAGVPTRNRSTIYDFGSHIGLWVSAFEVLVHPRKGDAGLRTVVALLRDFEWHSPRLRRRSFLIVKSWKKRNPNRWKKAKMRVNLVQNLYGELYEARNDFLHGNAVTASRLFPFRNKRRPSLTQVAPLVYKVALSCFLKVPYTRPKQGQQPNLKDLFDQRALENALLATLEDRAGCCKEGTFL